LRIIIKPSGPKSHNARGVELTLPASKAEMLDALDQAKIPYGSSEYLLEAHRDSPDYVKKMLGGLLGSVVYNPSLAEMNHLAERIEQLSEYEQYTLEGVIKIRDSCRIEDIINATHNLQRYSFYPDVVGIDVRIAFICFFLALVVLLNRRRCAAPAFLKS